MLIQRQYYLEKIINRINNGMIKVITGLRRSGKSYLLYKIFKKHLLETGVKKENIIEIQLDNIKYKSLRNPEKLYKYIEERLKKDGVNYILLDEIQLVSDFVDVLNGLLYLENVDIYVTGSNSRFLSSDILTEFRGRGDEIRVYPLSFKEYYSVSTLSFYEALDQYIIYGSLPMIATMNTDEQRIKYLKNLFRETYLKDLIARNDIRKKEDFEEVINIIGSTIGSLINPSKIENTFKSIKKTVLSRQTIDNYINFLEEAFIVEKSRRYNIKGRKYINSPYKCYFSDVGLRNAILNFRQIEETHIMENIIYNELKIRGYNVDVGEVDIRDKGIRKSLEVDFVATKGLKKFYIQSAYELISEEKKKQEKKSLLNIDDSFTKIIIVRNTQKERIDEDGIITICLKDFLLESKML